MSSQSRTSNNQNSRCDLLGDVRNRVLSGGEARQVRKNSAVLLHVLKRNVVQNGDQCLLAQQGAEFPFRPKPPGQVGGRQQRNTGTSLSEARVHLERLAAAWDNRHLVKP